MSAALPAQNAVSEALAEYELQRYWAIWQIPESRYAYMAGLRRDAWLILMDSEEAGLAALLDDARMNDRVPSQYRLDELTLPDALDAARAQAVPFRTSYGGTIKTVRGIEIRSKGLLSLGRAHRVPL